MREHLLRPSLTDTPATTGLYPLQWMLLPVFFLGPLPVILYSALNSWRLKRSLDAIVYVLALGGALALVDALMVRPTPGWVQQFAELTGSTNTTKNLSRLYAVALWAIFYFMHRAQHRSTAMMGNAPPRWIAGIVCCVAGVALTYGMVELMAYLRLGARMA